MRASEDVSYRLALARGFLDEFATGGYRCYAFPIFSFKEAYSMTSENVSVRIVSTRAPQQARGLVHPS